MSHAGLSHSIRLKTGYYEAEVPIWIDEMPEASAEEEGKEQ